jgi:O-antigen/teichoic acid export membrane protein
VSLKKNVIANYLGQGWSGLIGLAFLPLYIKYLGIEAYGLIGIFALLQAWLALLDMGMTPTLNREMARFTAGVHTSQSIRDLLRSLETICFGIAALIGLLIWAASGWLASDWLRVDKLPLEVVAQAIAIMGGVAALRFVEGIYRGAILGLQRQVFFNVVNASLATVRAVGAIAVLAWISPSIEAYFVWQGLVSIASVAILAVAAHGSLPGSTKPARFSRQAILDIRHFAGGMMATAFLALLLTQIDKVLLSKLISLEAFGYYTLAGTVVGAIYLLIAPVTQAFYPRFTELVTRDDAQELVRSYHFSAQLVTVLAAPAAMILIFFGESLMTLWTGNAILAHDVAPLLALLAAGTLLNGIMHIPYMLQLAHGWTSLTIKVNSVAAGILIPAILWVVPDYGAIGAAWVWVTLNAGYILFDIHFMHRRLLSTEKWRWYSQDVVTPMAAAMGTAWLCRLMMPDDLGRLGEMGVLLLSVGSALTAATLAANLVRHEFACLISGRIKEITAKTLSNSK